MTDEERRRPIRSRDSLWAMVVARALVRLNVPANAISLASVAFAAAAGALLFVSGREGFDAPLYLILAALMILMRLLCNMFDGMVALGSERASKVGELYNELPDRIADTLVLVGLGYGIGSELSGPALGWCGALLAVGTAYVRAFGVSLGLAPDFRGPMAKPHRMQLIIAACVLAALAPVANVDPRRVLWASLIVVVSGSAITILRRVSSLAATLGRRQS